MSRGSSRGKGLGSSRGKGGRRELPLCGRGSLGSDFFEEPVYHFPPRVRVISPKSVPSEDTITGKKIGQNTSMVRTT